MSSGLEDLDMDRVLSGALDNLPPQDANTVRVFLSSTFTDYGEERNLLFREAIPQLRKYCQHKGLDFQVSDMRWGIRDDAQIDHHTTKICIEEIKRCQETSKGPNFLALLGNRYGYRDYPSTIEAEEFDILVRAAYTVSKDPGLLDEWYIRDDNSVPPSYSIMPITSKFPYYNDETDENMKLREKDQEQWSNVNELLCMLLRDSAACAYKLGHFTYEQRQKYFTSVTEKEVTQGMLKSTRAAETTVCFKRNFEDIDIEDKIARRFIDIDAGLIDDEAQYLLRELKESKVPRVLKKEENVSQMSIKWAENGINRDDIQHAKYLEDFKNEVIHKLGALIYKALEKQRSWNENLPLYDEVLHHAHFCLCKTSVFVGRVETFNRIKFKMNKVFFREELLPGGNPNQKYRNMMDKYLDNLPKTDDTEADNDPMKEEKELQDHLANQGIQFGMEAEVFDMSAEEEKVMHLKCFHLKQFTKPIIIHGASGTGKTAMMAMLAQKVSQWLDDEPVKIIRFLGTSPNSKTIGNVLLSICEQIWANYENSKPSSMLSIGKDFPYLVQYFKALLMKINTNEKPLVIILDSVDQLEDLDYAYSMNWLPVILPQNVYIIVSMLPDEHGILANLKKRLPDEERYIEVPTLPKDTAGSILKQWLVDVDRTLTKEQNDVILAKLRMCPQPLFLKLCFEQAKEWCSYTPRSELTLGVTTRSLIEQYFGKLERTHGKVFTSKALGYLTVSYHGLSDVEMEDILSLDDEVLQDSYLYHLPPDPNVIRLPPLLWVRLKNDLREYITQQHADGKQMVKWFHRQFWEAADKRYVGDLCPVFNSNLADYFTGKWYDQVKPLELTKKKKGLYQDCYRGVPEQPIIFANNVFNYRKMSELPINLLVSKRYEDFISEICYSFDWLYYTCKAMSVNKVLADLVAAQKMLKKDIQVLKDEEEEEKKRLEKERKKKSKVPDMEVGKSKVKITDVSNEPDEEIEEVKNKPKQQTDDNEEVAAAEETEPVDINIDGDIFKLTSQMPRTIDELEELLIIVDMVHGMLLLANDAINKDPNNLIIQLLGQLSTDQATSEGLEGLMNQARRFSETCGLPLLIPSSKCFPSPGRDLMSISYIAIGYPGDDFEHEKKIAMSENGQTLYVIERSKTEVKSLKKGEGGDFLVKFNLENSTQQSVEQMMGSDIKRIDLVGADKYMYVEAYTHRDKYDPKYITIVTELNKQIPLPFTPDTNILSFSKTGKYCLIVEPYYRTGENDIATQTESSMVPSVEIAAMFDLEIQQKTSLKVILGEGEGEVSDKDLKNLTVNHGVFSPDEKYMVLVTNSGKVYCFLTERGKYIYKWDDLDENMYISSTAGSIKNAIIILENNYLLMPGGNRKNLMIRNLNNGENIKELVGQEYDINILQVNKNEDLVATATTTQVCINNMKKDLIVWDIERGERFSTCKSDYEWLAVRFFGPKDDYLLAVNNEPGKSRVVRVWYIGTTKKPCKDALPIHTIIGHSDTVLNIEVSSHYNTLVTASKDNTVRFWSIDKIIESCEKTMLMSQEMGMEGLKDYLMSEDDEQPRSPEEVPTISTAFTVCKSSKSAAVSSDTGWLLFCNLDQDQYSATRHKISKNGISHLITTKSGKYIISAGKEQPIIMWDASTGEEVKKIHPIKNVDIMVESCNILVTGSSGMECYGVLYDLDTGAVLKTLTGLYGFKTLCITSDAKKVVTTMFDYPMIFDVATGEANNFQQPDTMMYGCSHLCLSQCDRYVAACSTDGTVRVLEIESGKYKFRLKHKSSVVSADFSPDSCWLVTAGFRSILVWSMKNGSLVRSLQRHQDFITELRFACGGRYLVSCSKDKQIIIWDFKNSTSVATFHAHCPIQQVQFANDLSSLLYIPENVSYITVIKPNDVLREVLKGEEKNNVPQPIVQAQAFALTFSGQKAKAKSSAACNIL